MKVTPSIGFSRSVRVDVTLKDQFIGEDILLDEESAAKFCENLRQTANKIEEGFKK